MATLILPADVSWSDGATPEAPTARSTRAAVSSEAVEQVAKVLRSGEPVAILLGGSALRREPLLAAARIAAGTGARLFGETFVARTERGAGIPRVEKIQYFSEMAERQLAGLRHLVLVDAISPVTFFAYPGRPATSCPTGARCTCWPRDVTTRWAHWPPWPISSGPTSTRRRSKVPPPVRPTAP